MDFIASITGGEWGAIGSDPPANVGTFWGGVAEYNRETAILVYNDDTVISMEVVVTRQFE